MMMMVVLLVVVKGLRVFIRVLVCGIWEFSVKKLCISVWKLYCLLIIECVKVEDVVW